MGQPIYRYETIANGLLVKKGRRHSSTSSGDSDQYVNVFYKFITILALKQRIADGVLMEIHRLHRMIRERKERHVELKTEKIESQLDGDL